MKRTYVLGVIVIAGAVVAAAANLGAQQPPAAGQGREGGRGAGRGPGFPPVAAIEKVGNNLYLIQGQGGNTAVYIAEKGVVLVDTKLANNGQAILDQVKSVTDKPITHIINTHTHGDHTGSNQFFPASVEIVVQENTAANMQKMPVFQEAANKNGLPDKTYKDKMTLLSGKDAIDLYYFGPAHTNGDTFVVFRNNRVVHAGDAFANKGQPLIDRDERRQRHRVSRDDRESRQGHQERGHGHQRPFADDDEVAGPRRLRRIQSPVPGTREGVAQGRQDAGAGDDGLEVTGKVQRATTWQAGAAARAATSA